MEEGLQTFLFENFVPGALMAALSIAIVAWVIRICVFFGYRIKDRNKKSNPHENKETLGLPKGAMRTFLAIAFTSLATLALLGGIVDEGDKKWILGELGLIITFYFGAKTFESFVDSKAKTKAIEKANTAEEALKVLREADDQQSDSSQKTGASG